MIKISPQTRKMTEILFQTLISDLGNDKEINECGWANSKEIDNLVHDRNSPLHDVIQIDPIKGIRLNIIDGDTDNFFIKYEIKEKIEKNFRQSAKQLDYLLSLKNEEYKLNSSNQIIKKFFGTISNSRSSLNLAVFIGLFKMFENSGLPAPMIDIFAANLNPKQWNQISQETIPCLAFQLTRHLDQNITMSTLIQNYEKLPVQISKEDLTGMIKNSKNLDTVETILQWSKIKSELGNNLITTLGLNWFMLDILETNNFLPHDQNSIIKVHNSILSNIESSLKIDINEVFTQYDLFVRFCENESAEWGTEIIAFPEVV
jgi:hypothetical protein